jgi:DHA2 family multidrug resistance protein
MPVAGLVSAKFDPRKVIACGFFVMAVTMLMMTQINSQIDFQTMVWLRVVQVIGIPFIFIPISTLAYVGVAAEENNQISGITNFVRNIGGAVGVSFLMTFLARHRVSSRVDLVSHMSSGNILFKRLFATLSHGGQDSGSKHRALAQLQAIVDGQANTMSFISVFFFLVWLSCVLCLCHSS